VEDEKDFASILGITYGNYMNIKNQGTKARVLKYKIKEIEYIVDNNNELYDNEKIKKISKQYDKKQKDFLITAFGKTYETYEKLLEKQGTIYIGKGRMSNNFIEEYGDFLIKEAQKYNSKYSDLDIGEVIEYAIENLLYVEKNFSKKEEILDVLEKEIEKIVEQLNIKRYYDEKWKYSLDAPINFYTSKGEKDQIKRETKDNKVDVHKEVINLVEQEENEKSVANECIEKMQEYVKKGMNKKEIIKLVSEEMKIDKKQMLEIVKKELKRRIQVNEEILETR
jgi:uncharacterized protein YoaH (UPF0181 family)